MESYDFSGKKIVLFATSGSSGFGSALADLKNSVSDQTDLTEGIVVHGRQGIEEWKKWAESHLDPSSGNGGVRI